MSGKPGVISVSVSPSRCGKSLYILVNSLSHLPCPFSSPSRRDRSVAVAHAGETAHRMAREEGKIHSLSIDLTVVIFVHLPPFIGRRAMAVSRGRVEAPALAAVVTAHVADSTHLPCGPIFPSDPSQRSVFRARWLHSTPRFHGTS